MFQNLKMIIEILGLFFMLFVTIYTAIVAAFGYIASHSDFVLHNPNKKDGEND